MDTLEQLFHSMPAEVREKIIRFTYKPQPEELLTEIRDFLSSKRIFTGTNNNYRPL